ncbi:DUF2690 domain-containing protein [Plantactinospora siamensis]|uniref:DUF2690 domain-containing protein n=1 Tax=Plantactinospora siamensis TaxID=555372 RepID=A0ABV6NU38_9ACTN
MSGQNGKVSDLTSADARLGEFVAELARLRREAGQPSLRKMSATAHYSHTALSSVLSGGRLPSRELTLAFVRACGGDEEAWAERWHRENALSQGAEPGTAQPPATAQPRGTAQPPGTAQPLATAEPPVGPDRRRRLPRWALVAAGGLATLATIAAIGLVTGALPPRRAAEPAAPPAPWSAPDGADPQEQHCQVDAISARTVQVPDRTAGRPPYGALTLRYSPHCQAAWPLFVSTERVPMGVTIRLRITRPADRAVSRFDYPYLVKHQVYSVFGNVLKTTGGCVSVAVEISTADNRSTLATADSPCEVLRPGV